MKNLFSSFQETSRTVHLHAAALVKHISLPIKQTPLEFTPLCVVLHSGRARACQDWKGRSNKPQRQGRTAQSLQSRDLHGLTTLQLPEEGRAFSGIPGDCSIVFYPEFTLCEPCFSYAFTYISCSVEQRWFHYPTNSFVLQQPSSSTPSLLF